MTYGRTDEWGYKAVENPLDMHDFHATILHLLGLDHTRLNLSLWRTGYAPDRRLRESGQGNPGLRLTSAPCCFMARDPALPCG